MNFWWDFIEDFQQAAQDFNLMLLNQPCGFVNVWHVVKEAFCFWGIEGKSPKSQEYGNSRMTETWKTDSNGIRSGVIACLITMMA